jgi:hypothetical protein
MKTRTLVRRFGSALTILGIAAFLWGCGQAAPTAPVSSDQQQLTPAGGNYTPADGGDDRWW